MARRTVATKTIQCWPGGECYEYRGDLDGPENQRSLRGRARLAKWRKGSAEEWRKIRISTRAEMYWERDGLGCDSGLVTDLIRAATSGELRRGGGAGGADDLAEGFDYESLRNLYADPSDWDAVKCLEYLHEHTNEQNHYLMRSKDWDGEVARMSAHEGIDPDEWEATAAEELRDACREHCQENPAEVYEWWRVSEWLCRQLHEIGEVTIDNGYGCWWGRQATGQSLLMDGTLQQIAAQYERADG